MKGDLFQDKRTFQKSHRYGGREVLRVQAELVSGERAAELHVAALQKELIGYAERELALLAARELRQAVAEGNGYRFVPHTYRLEVSRRLVRGRWCVRLEARHTQGDLCNSVRALQMHWSRDGAFQYKAKLLK